MTQPTQDQWDAFINVVGRAVVFPKYRAQIMALTDPEAWAQDQGMGLPLSRFFGECARIEMEVSIIQVDRMRQLLGIKSPLVLWED